MNLMTNKRYTVEVDAGGHIQQLAGEYRKKGNILTRIISDEVKRSGIEVSLNVIDLYTTHLKIVSVKEVKGEENE